MVAVTNYNEPGRTAELGAGDGLLQADYLMASLSGGHCRFGGIQIPFDAIADARRGGLHGIAG